MVLRYDHPTYLTRRYFTHQTGGAGGAALGTATAGTSGYFMVPGGHNVRLVAAHANVRVAGTATTNDYELQIGTDSVGIFAMTSNAAGISSSIGNTASPLGTATQFQSISLIKQDGETGEVDFTYEYEVLPGSVLA